MAWNLVLIIFPMRGHTNYYAKAPNVWMTSRIMSTQPSFPWMRWKQNLNSPLQIMMIGSCFLPKIIDKWRHVLEKNLEATYHSQWLWFYYNSEDNPAFVMQYANDSIPCGRLQHQVSIPLIVKCFTADTHLRCLSEWERPTGEFSGFSHQVKIIYVFKGPKENCKQEKIAFFYGKEATMGWNPDCWRWVEGFHFPNYTTKFGRDLVINMVPGMS